jgi:hypothetical protein
VLKRGLLNEGQRLDAAKEVLGRLAAPKKAPSAQAGLVRTTATQQISSRSAKTGTAYQRAPCCDLELARESGKPTPSSSICADEARMGSKSNERTTKREIKTLIAVKER